MVGLVFNAQRSLIRVTDDGPGIMGKPY